MGGESSADTSLRETLSLNSAVPLSSGFMMPALGFGVYQNYTTHESVLEAFDAGYRHVDTAQAYRNEGHVGSAFRDSGLDRKDVFITTKCISKTHGYETTLRAVDVSLGRLGMDYIDLYLIHDPHKGREKRLDTYRALLQARDAGKVRSVGVSNFGVRHLEELRDARLEMPAVNQIELHPFCQQTEIVAYCKAHDIVVQAYSPLVRGMRHAAAIDDVAAKHGKDRAHVLLRWSLRKGYVPLPKSATPSRIHANTDLYDFALDDADMGRLDALDMGKEGAVTWNPVDVE